MTNLPNPATGKALEKLADAFLAGEISREQLIEQTANLGLALDLLDLLLTSRAHVATGPRTAAEKNKAIYQRFDGRLVESWVKNDFTGLMKQLGVELPMAR